jgi:hypothetical protein
MMARSGALYQYTIRKEIVAEPISGQFGKCGRIIVSVKTNGDL